MRRKLKALVAADIVGYSRLLAEDEDAVLSLLQILRSEFLLPGAERFDGQLSRFLGDSALLEFDSALGAVEFSIALQRGLARRRHAIPDRIPLILRIGINLGDVVIQNGDLHGDGVNIAVRLEALSEPGGICLSESVYAQIKNRLASHFIAIGEHNLKNIADPIKVWRWRPELEPAITTEADGFPGGAQRINGHAVLDPKLVDLLLRLYVQSGLLAVSEALDSLAEDEGSANRLEELSLHIGERLEAMRDLFRAVKVERIDGQAERSSDKGAHQTLGEFVSSVFNDSEMGFALRLIPDAQAVMAANEPFPVKRQRLLTLLGRDLNEEFFMRSRSLIAYAYID